MLDLITLLAAPAAALMLALPFGTHFRPAAGGRQMRAVYLFRRTRAPIAMVAPDDAPPFAPEQLEPIIWTVRDFVETSMPKSQGYDVTSIRFDEEALVAVRGAHVSVCAVFRSANTAAIRRDLVRFIPDFEDRNEGRPQTWEDACRFAGEAADAMSPLIAVVWRPSPARATALAAAFPSFTCLARGTP